MPPPYKRLPVTVVEFRQQLSFCPFFRRCGMAENPTLRRSAHKAKSLETIDVVPMINQEKSCVEP
jgi:hypothetical protein